MAAPTDFEFLRSKADDTATLKTLDIIQRDWKLVREKGMVLKGKSLFKLKLDGITLWLRKNGASSAIDTYLEIFLHRGHIIHPAFNGKKDLVIVDVGANEGYYTLKMKQNNPALRIIAVEPAPETFKMLEKNVKSNKLKNVTLVRKALDKKEGKITFEFLPQVTVIAAKDIGMQKRPWLNARPKFLREIKKMTVNATTLPKLLKKENVCEVDILKLDVEGSELDILSASESVLKNIKKIVIEWHTPELRVSCTKFLLERGFDLVYTDLRKGERCGDIYFINKKNHKD